jgi:hypothetical protein
MSALRIPAISPYGAKDRDWRDYFLAYATALDDTGFPRAGSFGIGFNCCTDLSTATSEEIRCSIIANSSDSTTPKINSRYRQVTSAYAALTPNALVALKKGRKIVAFARIVGPYTYDPSHVGDKTYHPHRWNYEVVRRATVAEENSGTGNLRLTFVPDSVPLPENVLITPSPVPAPAPPVSVPAPTLAALAARIAELEAANAAQAARIAELEADSAKLVALRTALTALTA